MPENPVVIDEAVAQTQAAFRTAERRLLCAIVLTRSGVVQATPLAKIIAQLRKIPRAEALNKLIRGSGIIMRDASREEAAEVGEEVHRQGLSFILVPTKELLQLAYVREVKNVKVSEVALACITRDQDEIAVQWHDLFLVTCGCVEREEKKIIWREEGEFMPQLFFNADAEEEEFIPRRLVMTFGTFPPFTAMHFECNITEDISVPDTQPYLPKQPFEKIGRTIYQMHQKQAQNKGMRLLSITGMKSHWKGLTFKTIEQLREYNMWLGVLRKYQVNVIGTKHSKFSILSLLQPEFKVEEKIPAARRAAEERKEVLQPTEISAMPPIIPDKSGFLVEHGRLVTVSSAVAVILLIIWILVQVLR